MWLHWHLQRLARSSAGVPGGSHTRVRRSTMRPGTDSMVPGATEQHTTGVPSSWQANTDARMQAGPRRAHEPTKFFLDEPSGRYRVGDTVRLRFEVRRRAGPPDATCAHELGNSCKGPRCMAWPPMSCSCAHVLAHQNTSACVLCRRPGSRTGPGPCSLCGTTVQPTAPQSTRCSLACVGELGGSGSWHKPEVPHF